MSVPMVNGKRVTGMDALVEYLIKDIDPEALWRILDDAVYDLSWPVFDFGSDIQLGYVSESMVNTLYNLRRLRDIVGQMSVVDAV